jgi:hypothetical protein
MRLPKSRWVNQPTTVFAQDSLLNRLPEINTLLGRRQIYSLQLAQPPGTGSPGVLAPGLADGNLASSQNYEIVQTERGAARW